MRLLCSCLVGLLCLCSNVRAGEPPKFELKDGDRVVLVGDTLIERDQRYGYLETLLSIANPDKSLVFRNLGWSGDTVAGVSRSGFDPPAAGFEQLRQQILAVKPTVVVVGYGMADSFEGKAGLSAFEHGMNRLLDVIATTKARIVLLSPIAHFNMSPPLPDPTKHNRDLELYGDVIKKVAKLRSAPFVDLFGDFTLMYSVPREDQPKPYMPLTTNGIHLTEDGYWAQRVLISQQLAKDFASTYSVALGQDGKIQSIGTTNVSHIQRIPAGCALKWSKISCPFPSPALRQRFRSRFSFRETWRSRNSPPEHTC